MEEMDAIKKRRKAIRGTFTRIINEINGEFEKSQIDRNDIYSKFNRLESYYTKLVDLNEKYQALLVVKEGITEESIDREWQECNKYEEEKFDIQQKVSVLRNPDKEETIPIASEDTVINVKLPELALKSYDGSLEGWLPWWAQFSKIHENQNLSDSDRFLYLRQAIVPNSEAYRVVASYPVTRANYALAVQALQERFGDPNILTELYVRRLLNSVISNVKKENRNLSSLYDELNSHLRSLETLGIDPQLSGIFLYPLVESSLPSDILKIWHRHPSSGYALELAKREESDKGVGGAQERLRLLLDFIKAEVRSAQRLKFVEKGFKQEEPYKRSYNDGTRTRSNFRPATVSSLFGGRTNIKCFFCERTNHASHQCNSIMKMYPRERNDKIRSAHLCFKCLRKGHIQSQCREQLECKNCGRNHLEVLCEGNSSNRLTKPGRENLKENAPEPIASLSSQACTGLPWKVEKESIPSNLDIAIKRLDISTKKMTSQNKLTEYSQIFRDWLTEGLIERVEENPLERRGYYLPHRPVYKMESKTTPIRPVFDASCIGHNGLSLNQCLEKGPNLLERIPEMMIRFRENKFGVTADIRKAFQMVAIEESERNYLRFLWWEKESDRELIAYRHKRLVFGLNCSPFVLNAVIEYHLQSIRGPLVQWAKILAQSFYMDNCITSLETKQEVQEFQKAAIEIMDRAKMDLREWEYSLEENPEKGTCTKILGVVWNKMEDSLKCELPDILSLQPKLTKRLVLSMVQRIFDPLGFCAPVFLPPKLLLQRSWGLKLGWDTPLPESIAQEFRTWLDQIKFIELIKIPRYMWNDLIFPTEVHIFCDASQIGYGAVAYLRSETGRENTLTLIWSKVRLAPMKSITIPRLELMAMVLGARLANAIQAALKRKCETTLWSDSTTALSWIKKEIEWRVFVRNRVREIQATTNLNDWRFVPSQLNPADLLSRGCPPSQFVQSRWWEGPEWLKKPKEFWPNSEFSINPKEINVEENIMKTNINFNIDYKDWILTRRSNYSLNIRVMSYVLRFLGKLKKQSTETGPLKVSELDLAEKKLIRMIQEKVSMEKSNATKSFKILKNTDGLWCVESKLLHGQVPEEFKTPIILPGDHPFVEQLIWEVHLKNGHVGVQFILSKLREKFWIIRGRKTIKKIISKCIACKRLKEKYLQRPMAALPENRIGLGKPFQITGVDLLGPLHLKEGGKVWVAAFTCAVYRAIHLELVKSLETGVFMMALHRFICRRGRPEKIYSDNGTNFAKLNRIFKRLDWTRIERETSIKRIQWIFIPPSAPWWGGFWERMVRTIKEMLIKMLGHRKLKYVQLQTALCEIESIINNRPLTYVSEDDNDLKPLTPNEFLQNGPESSFPECENLKPEMLHTRYRELGQLKRELKQRFLKEYLGALIQKSENIDRRQLKVGDVVLIGQENLKRMFWPKGRIVNLIPGKDGIVRVAHVKTSTGTLIRALQRLHPLEISSNVKTIQMDNSNTEPQSDAFLGNRPNIESRDSRNRYGRLAAADQAEQTRLRNILQAASCGRKDVGEVSYKQSLVDGKTSEKYPTSSVLWTERRLRIRCSICNMSSHLDVMCTKRILDRGGSSKSPTVQDETLAKLSTSPDVLLPTLRVTLKRNRTEKTARAIIDTGSQRSYILHSTAMEMEYEQSRREFFRHSLFGGSSTDVVEHEVYTIHLSDINNSYRCEFEALGQPLICGSIPPVCPRSFLEGSEELDVSDLMRDRIEVLIGADIAGRLLTDDQRRISPGLVAIRTKLGWTVMGKIPPTEVRDDISSLCVTTFLSLDLENLWKLDAIGVSDAEVEKKTQSLQAEMEEHFAHTTTRDIEGRYEGPNLIEIIPRLLNKFRKYEVGVSSDIEKAFLQIRMKEEDRDAAVFEIAGVDLTGHLILNNKKKAWIVFFTYAVYRGVHLELVTSLSMEAFLQAFRRFIARRGRPLIVYSDNGTNFKGMANALKKIDFSRLKCDTTLKNITWKFIPPGAPWWGGWWERLIGMMKQLLFRILGQTSLGYEELSNYRIFWIPETRNETPEDYHTIQGGRHGAHWTREFKETTLAVSQNNPTLSRKGWTCEGFESENFIRLGPGTPGRPGGKTWKHLQ
ncbi:hypothetical protein LAZ67_3003366, partial [Cordylochernes scorpioides]